MLWVAYGIDIEEIRDFAKVMHDFKTLGFDAAKIYNEYHTALSLRQETKDNERKNKELYDQRSDLQMEVLSLKSQLSMHSQTLNAFSELEAMGFGLKEVKQLRLTVFEIADANHIPEDQAVRKFLKDVEEQYDRKLGFEKEAEAKAKEVQSLKNQVNHYRFTLQATPFVGPALTNLLQNRVSEQDIIEINRFVQDFKISIIPLDDCSDGKDTKHDKDNKPNEKGFCRSLIDGLKRYGGIKNAIKEHSEKLDSIKQEINYSKKQKQEVLSYCQIAVALTGLINYKISYFKGLMDHYLNELKHNKIKTTTISPPMLIFVIYDKSNNKEKGEGEGEK